MKTNSKQVAGLILGLTVILAAVAGHYMTLVPTAHILAGPDTSLSVERNCDGVAVATKGLLNKPGIRDGSTMTLMAMGPSRLDPEPELQFTVPIPILSDVVMGRAEAEAKYAQELEAFLSQLKQACDELEDTSHTPLYQMVKQGLAHLHSDAIHCTGLGACYFLIKTDLVEDVHPVLRALLAEAAKDPQMPTPPELAGSLGNSGVAIVFCGTSEVRPPNQQSAAPPPLEIRKRIWNELFTHPELVSYQPFCAAPSGQ